MKKIIKIILIVVIMLSVQIPANVVYGSTANRPPVGSSGSTSEETEVEYSLASETTWSDIFSQAKNFLDTGKNGATGIEDDDINKASSIIFNTLVAVGTVLAVIIGGILGIQFMIASAEDKAKIKEAFIPYVLGCVIVFGAFGIWKLVVNLLQSVAV